jgi:glycosyltransferase involved in cell wall biosynthesis
MDNKPFLVSVVTPAYNAGKYIRKAVEAAVIQE